MLFLFFSLDLLLFGKGGSERVSLIFFFLFHKCTCSYWVQIFFPEIHGPDAIFFLEHYNTASCRYCSDSKDKVAGKSLSWSEREVVAGTLAQAQAAEDEYNLGPQKVSVENAKKRDTYSLPPLLSPTSFFFGEFWHDGVCSHSGRGSNNGFVLLLISPF